MKKKIIIAVCTVLIVIVSALSLIGCGEKYLIGFDIELAKAVAKDLEINVKFIEIVWDNKENEIESNKIDTIWNGLTITPEREEQWSIANPYMNNNQVAVIRKADESKYTTEDTLATGKIVFESGSAGAEVADKIIPGASAQKIGLSAQIDTLTELIANTAEIAIIDSVMANYYVSQPNTSFSTNLMIVPNLILAREQYGVAFRKNSILCDKVNGSLSKLFADGTIDAIAEKYGLKSELSPFTYTSKTDEQMTNEENAEWKKYKTKGMKVGYTLYAPIAFKK